MTAQLCLVPFNKRNTLTLSPLNRLTEQFLEIQHRNPQSKTEICTFSVCLSPRRLLSQDEQLEGLFLPTRAPRWEESEENHLYWEPGSRRGWHFAWCFQVHSLVSENPGIFLGIVSPRVSPLVLCGHLGMTAQLSGAVWDIIGCFIGSCPSSYQMPGPPLYSTLWPSKRDLGR